MTPFCGANPVKFDLHVGCGARPGGETGRHNGLKIRRPLTRRTGSIPVLGTRICFGKFSKVRKAVFSNENGFFVVLGTF